MLQLTMTRTLRGPHRAQSENVAQPCYRSQQSVAESERRPSRPVLSMQVVGHGLYSMPSAQNFESYVIPYRTAQIDKCNDRFDETVTKIPLQKQFSHFRRQWPPPLTIFSQNFSIVTHDRDIFRLRSQFLSAEVTGHQDRRISQTQERSVRTNQSMN